MATTDEKSQKSRRGKHKNREEKMNEITAKNAEDKLAKAAQKGDKAAEEKLLNRYAPLVR